ncbi:MAG: hypothetical protein HETSPECPRED_004033 [Heterodermia speciosa]|uniref:Anaphase-promoting complex subunit 4 WD40 domain-containing protein n=1 Tax=Heterodermia speciosa TaxID=116794 RepID=A0A8H3IMX6_9LECA|nr:MAG: hypothetical protein HETSPECPRED_004033 [Heterodermia speciosa]
MASSRPPFSSDQPPDDDDTLLDAAEAAEEVIPDQDHPMDSDDASDTDSANPLDQDEEEIQLQNDSIAHFDAHRDSVFCIAQHPTIPNTIATGGGDDTTYIFSTNPSSPRLLPKSYESNPDPSSTRASLLTSAKLTGHTDSVNALTYTLPDGKYLLSGGLDGQLRAYSTTDPSYPLLAAAQEVPEINFVIPSPHPSYPNTIALGASDGSVWVYTVDPPDSPLRILQAYYLHTASCTAGAWSPDGKLLATVSEDGSLYVWDPFGEAAAVGIDAGGAQAIVGLTASDQRFAVEGGLYSVAVAPSGAFVVVGGAEGMIRVVGLPRVGGTGVSTTAGKKGAGSKSKSGGGRKAGAANGSGGGSAGQAGAVLASLQVQSEGVETLSFASPPLSLLGAGSLDGSIVLFDTAHNFAVRRHIREAHEEYAVVQVDFSRENGQEHLLTSCGLDGAVRRWDTRGGTAAAGQGLVGEWRGHRGEGEGGGVLGFVQGGKEGKIITAGDDGVVLVFGEDKGQL